MPPPEQPADAGKIRPADEGRTLNSSPQPSSDDPADVTIHLFCGERSDRSTGLTWGSDSVFVYMIEDLVLASHGHPADESSSGMTAHFRTCADALVAAQRIQTACQEFLSCRPGDYVGSATLIHPLNTSSLNAETMRSELRLAKPGQILVSSEIARRLQEYPGVQLRRIPGLTLGGQGQEEL